MKRLEYFKDSILFFIYFDFFINWVIIVKYLLIWQKMHQWSHVEGLRIEDNCAGNLTGYSNSSFGETPLMNSQKSYDSHNQNHSLSFEYFFDETTMEYCCNTCSYKSTFKNNVNRHLLTHSGLKPFKCQLCEYSCTQKGHLTLHLRTHSGVKPFKCHFCEFSFSQKGSLKRHLYSHSQKHWRERLENLLLAVQIIN